jgi:hypothetical protein
MCKGGCNLNQKKLSDDSNSDSNKIKRAISNVYYLFPSPSEILTTIKEGGLVFHPELLNSNDKREQYIKQNDQYLNLGVYLADFSYCCIFGRNNEAEYYLASIRHMSDEVMLSTEINNQFIEKLEYKDNSIDSLMAISDEFFNKIINNLENNNRQNDVAIISIGAYIECLYLSVNNVKEYSSQNPIIRKITEQKFAFNNLFKYSQKYLSREDIAKSFSYIAQINDAFGEFSKFEGNVRVKEDSKYHLIITGGKTTVFTEAQFNSFKGSIIKIRKTITR